MEKRQTVDPKPSPEIKSCTFKPLFDQEKVQKSTSTKVVTNKAAKPKPEQPQQQAKPQEDHKPMQEKSLETSKPVII